MDEEELLSNAAALESAFEEEQRLKQQIEETEKTEIKVNNYTCVLCNLDIQSELCAEAMKHKLAYIELSS